MPNLRLYREFYRIDYVDGINDNYTLMDPFALSARTYSFNDSDFVESPEVFRESAGNYYVNINPSLYVYPNIYQLIWYVRYLDNGIMRQLNNRFIFDPINQNIVTQIDIELLGTFQDIC